MEVSIWATLAAAIPQCCCQLGRKRPPSSFPARRIKWCHSRSSAGNLTRDRILDNISLYWLTNTATSSARLYWENAQSILAAIASGQKPPELSLPVAFTVFPGEIFQAPRSWAEKVYPNLIYFNEADRGGHFAAWEEPELFSQEMRTAFASLR